MATSVEVPRLITQNNVVDFETNSNDTTSSCTSSSVDQDFLSEHKSDNSEHILDAESAKASSSDEITNVQSIVKIEPSSANAEAPSNDVTANVQSVLKVEPSSANAEAPSNDETANVQSASKVDTTIAASASEDDRPNPALATAHTLVDDDDSSNSDDLTVNQSHFDAFGLPKELLEEERKMALETEKEFSEFSQAHANLGRAEKERRYKTLMTLLGKSNQYARYMSEKLVRAKQNLEATAADAEPPKVLQNATNKRKGAPASAPPAKRAKLEDGVVKFDPETHYLNDNGLVVSKRQPRLLTGGVMRDYQLDGLEWLVALYKNAVNGILADEMGLGKTIQLISLLCHLREKNIYGPHLIIAPLSTLPNWIFEFANFAPSVPVVLFHGAEEKRLQIRDQFIDALRSNRRHELPVVVTSYEMPLRDKRFLSLVKWCSVVVDEGHRLKNYNSLLAIELRKYRADSRLLLTGTPLQNNITELWSLLNYLIPEIFDDLPTFETLFDFSELGDAERHDALIQKEKQEQIISKMHQILEPFLLRRLKSDVNIYLPRKKEILVYAPLTPEQEALYKATLDRTILAEAGHVDEVDATSTKRRCRLKQISYNEDWNIDEEAEYAPVLHELQKAHQRRPVVRDGVEYVYNIKLLQPLVMCRKIVNHPYLVRTPVRPGSRDIVVDERMITQSGKLLVLDALLPRLKADGHKVLLFSTFTLMLDMIEDYVLMRGHKYVRLDGTCKIEDRLESIKQFNADPETFVFLISTRAGGLGINLTAADTVIIYNSDWNPQVDLQAQDRCHRIGQTRPVVVYRLVTAGTIDERVVNCATVKRRLEKLVVKEGKFKQQLQTKDEEISVDELHELLKSTDYKQVIHPNGLVLSDEQIEQLLDRSDLLDEQEEAVSAKKTAVRKRAARSSKVKKGENVT